MRRKNENMPSLYVLVNKNTYLDHLNPNYKKTPKIPITFVSK